MGVSQPRQNRTHCYGPGAPSASGTNGSLLLVPMRRQNSLPALNSDSALEGSARERENVGQDDRER